MNLALCVCVCLCAYHTCVRVSENVCMLFVHGVIYVGPTYIIALFSGVFLSQICYIIF